MDDPSESGHLPPPPAAAPAAAASAATKVCVRQTSPNHPSTVVQECPLSLCRCRCDFSLRSPLDCSASDHRSALCSLWFLLTMVLVLVEWRVCSPTGRTFEPASWQIGRQHLKRSALLMTRRERVSAWSIEQPQVRSCSCLRTREQTAGHEADPFHKYRAHRR